MGWLFLLEGRDLLRRMESLKSLHRLHLVSLGEVAVAKHHLNP